MFEAFRVLVSDIAREGEWPGPGRGVRRSRSLAGQRIAAHLDSFAFPGRIARDLSLTEQDG